MSKTAIVVEGIVTPDGTLQLEEKILLPAGRVQVAILPLPDLSQDLFLQRMARIWADQQTRGHVPRSSEAIAEDRRRLGEEFEEEIQEAIQLQEECRQARQQVEQAKKLEE